MKNMICTALLTLVLAIANKGVANAGPAAELWSRWQAHNAHSERFIDHSAWARFLARYVVEGKDGINRVNYGGVSKADRLMLSAYIDDLAALPISSFNRNEQFAYWANLYNALTIQVILDHYPVRSIRDIRVSPGWFSIGPWGKKLVSIEGEHLSLDDIEHRIMRPIWKDPRIHYMVNCAALGCPNLQRQPFTATNYNQMLEAAAREFINHRRGARVEDERLYVSSIYHWYKEDFGNSDAGVIAHLKQYARDELADDLSAVSRIYRHEYDWSLNETGEGDS